MRKLLYIFIVLLLCGCHDDYWNLGDSYVYNNGYIYYVTSVHYKNGVRYEQYEELVPYKVVSYGYDENYIIAYQNPDSAAYRQFTIDTYKESSELTKYDQEKIDSLESMLNSMLSIQDCYWIICKKEKIVYGPMTEAEFNKRYKKWT